jgi:ketosteroid isomerase-like protein
VATTKTRKSARKSAGPKKTAARAGKAKASKAKASKAKARPRKAVRVSRPARRPPARKGPAPSASDAMRALARRIIDLTIKNDDESTLALYAADVESTEMGQPPLRGIDAIRGKFAGWRNMVSDSSFAPRRVCVDGNTIVIEWVGSMTMAGTGKQVEMHEVAIHEIRDGKIAREAYFYNPGAMA